MDYELLVDGWIEDGQAFISELVKTQIDVAIAFWVKTSEEGLWFLYIGSADLGSMTTADAYRAAYSALMSSDPMWMTLSDIKIVHPSNPIAVEAIGIRDRQPAWKEVRFHGEKLGNLSIEEALIYPRVMGFMGRDAVIHKVASLMSRTGVLSPSMVTLRDGSKIQAVPTGIQANFPAGVQIVLRDSANGTDRVVSVDDVIRIN